MSVRTLVESDKGRRATVALRAARTSTDTLLGSEPWQHTKKGGTR